MDAARIVEGRTQPFRLSWRVTPVRLAVALVLAALAVRLLGLGLRPLWLDEAYSAWFASRGWHELWTVVPTYEPHPPFYYSLLKLWRDLFGGEPAALRAVSVLVGIATVPVVIAVAFEQEKLEPSGRPRLRVGFSGFLAAFAPMLVILDQEARPYPLLILAYAVAILGLLRLLREFAGGGAGRWSSWTLLAGGTELALWAHGLGALYAVCLATALAPIWLTRVDRERLVRGGVIAAAVVLFYLPCLLMLASRVGDWGSGWLKFDAESLFRLIGLYAVPYEALSVVTAIAGIAMLLVIKRAVQSGFAARGWNAERAILWLWWGPTLLALLTSLLFMPIFLPRTLAATLVPAYLAMASVVARIPARRERLGLIGLICLPLLFGAVQVALREPPERWDEVGAFLAQHAGPLDQVWLYPNDSALPLRQAGFARRMRGIPGDYPAVGFKGPIRAGSPAVVSLTRQQAERVATDPAIRTIPTIWLVTRQSEQFDPAGDLPAALAKTRRPGAIHKWKYIAVQPFVAAR
jgi:hypothetical protein